MPKKSEKQKEIDKKGKERMKRYEDKLSQKVDRETLSDNQTVMKYWAKYDDGPWEEYEYVYTKKKK